MSAAGEVRTVTRGTGAAITALVSGSMVLAGRICRCAGLALAWAWDQASIDTQATAATQAKADKAPQAKARPGKTKKKAGPDHDPKAGLDEDQEAPQESEEPKQPPVKPIRRPVPETLGMLALGGVLAAGAASTLGTLAWPYLQQLAPWRGLIALGGGLAWMVAAWMVAPPPAAPDDEDQDQEQAEDQVPDEDAEDQEACAGDQLARHVLAALAELEEQDRPGGPGGLHVTALIASAEERRLLDPGSMDKTAMRSWLEESGLPVTKSVKVRGEVDYGVRVDRVTEALGMSPAAALTHLFGGAPTSTTPTTPAQAPAEAPAEPAVAPVQAPRLALLKPLPDGETQDPAQGAA